MKTIFTLFSSLLLSAAVFATDAKPKSLLFVKSNVAGALTVVVDGKRFESNTNSIIIKDVNAGFHSIKVYRLKTNGVFSLFSKRLEMVYNSSLSVKPATQIDLTIDRFGRITLQESKIFHGREGRGWDNDYDRNGRDDDHDFDFDHDGKFGDYDNHYGYTSEMSGMNDREFSRLLQDIKKEWLESNKLKSATQIVKTTNLSSAQVKQLVLLFSFETNKLELAKQAYITTVDKKNYYMLNDVFSFNSSRDELARYIRSCQ